MARKTIQQYQRDAARLSDRVPELKKLARKKKLTPGDKWRVSYYSNIASELRKKVDDRKEKFRHYEWPVERHIPETILKKEARRLAKYTAKPERFREFAKQKHLTGAQKGAIRRKMNLLRHTENLFSLTPEQARKLPKHAIVGHGVNAIRLRNVGPKTRITRVVENKMYVISSGRKWIYEATGTEQEAIAEAAEKAFKSGAVAVYFWTVHGRVGGASLDMADLLYSLRNQYMQYLTANAERAQSTDWLLGIAYTKDEGELERFFGE